MRVALFPAPEGKKSHAVAPKLPLRSNRFKPTKSVSRGGKMSKWNRWAAWLLVFPLAVTPLACGGDADDRAALEEDELARELDLALSGDSVPATFEDTATGVTPVPEPTAPPTRTAPSPQPRRQTPPPVTRPQPQTPAPQPPPQRQPDPAPAPRTVTSTVPSGTSVALTLNETLSTETNRAGDSFTATVQQAITDGNGNVVVPAGATVRGRVTSVQKSGRVGETAVLNLAFETVSFGGDSYPFDASVVQANPQRKSRESTGEQVGKAAAGAAAGAILGRVIGKSTSSTIKGAVIGAAAGTAIAMGTADVDAVLPAGSTMVVRVESPVRVTRTIS
jgi:hypothetical protein